jgi:hypothetical protein
LGGGFPAPKRKGQPALAFFPSVEGSMTGDDGQTFMLRVKRPTLLVIAIGEGLPFAGRRIRHNRNHL